MKTQGVEYWNEKAMKCYEAASEHRSNGDAARADMAEQAYSVAVAQAIALGSRAFHFTEAR